MPAQRNSWAYKVTIKEIEIHLKSSMSKRTLVSLSLFGVGGLTLLGSLVLDFIRGRPFNPGYLQLSGVAVGLIFIVLGMLVYRNYRPQIVVTIINKPEILLVWCKTWLPFVITITPFLVWISIKYLNLDFWYDEVYSLVNFTFKPFAKIVTTYPAPNNHIFANILNFLYLKAIGMPDIFILGDAPWKIRLLMLAISLVGIIYLFLIGKKFFNELVAYLAIIIMVTTIPFYNFAVQVRGYGPSITITCMIIYYMSCFMQKPTWKHAILITVLSALMLYTIPSNLYFLGGLGFYYLISSMINTNLFSKQPIKDELRRAAINEQGTELRFRKNRFMLFLMNQRTWIAVMLFVSVGFAALLYAPVLHQVIDNDYVRSNSMFRSYTLTQLMPRVFVFFLSERYIFGLIMVLALPILLRNFNKASFKSLTESYIFFVIVFITPFVFSFIRGDTPFCRVFLFLTPIFSLFMAVNIYLLYLQIPDFKRKYIITIVFTVIYCYGTFAFALKHRDANLLADIKEGRTSQDILYNYYQAYYHPSQVFKDFSQHDASSDIPVMLNESGDTIAIPFYLAKYNIKPYKMESGVDLFTNSQGQVHVITAHPNQFLVDINQKYPDLKCELLNKELDFLNLLSCECKSGTDCPPDETPIQ